MGQPVTLREGEVRILSLPPEQQVLAYAFPGEARALPFEVLTCRLTLSRDGKIRCPDTTAEVPLYAMWFMGALVALLVFPVATIAARHVVSWPKELPGPVHQIASYLTGASLTGASLTGVVVVMFLTTGIIQRWVSQLTAIFSGAVDVIIAAIAVSVAILMFLTRVRAYIPPR